MTSPREEIIQTRRIGPNGALLLYRTVSVVVRSRNFPPPEGSSLWDESATTEVAHEFLDGPRGTRRLSDLALRSVDDASFERLLEAAVVNHMRERSRRTDMGKLVLRVAELLTGDEAFQSQGGQPSRWSLLKGPTIPSSTPAPELAESVAGIEISRPVWRSSRRDSPLADRASFVRLISTVLSAANGTLTAVDIAHAISARVDYRRSAISVDLDVLEGVAEPAPTADPAVAATAQIRGRQIFDELDDRERILVATVERPVRDLGEVLAVRRSQAALLRQRLTDRLHQELADDDDPAATVASIRALCESWLQDRTLGGGATSSSTTQRQKRRQSR
jgi:hypothetical protein